MEYVTKTREIAGRYSTGQIKNNFNIKILKPYLEFSSCEIEYTLRLVSLLCDM